MNSNWCKCTKEMFHCNNYKNIQASLDFFNFLFLYWKDFPRQRATHHSGVLDIEECITYMPLKLNFPLETPIFGEN